MGNSESKCDEDCRVKNAMHCFELSEALQRQFKDRIRRFMRDQNSPELSKAHVDADFKYALKHYKDVPRPAKLQEIYNRYSVLIAFLPKCADRCLKL